MTTSTFVSQADHLELTNAVFTALPTFTMCTFMLPKTVIKQINKFMKHCLLHGSDNDDKKPPKQPRNWLVYPRKRY